MYLKTCHFEVFAANAAIFREFRLFVIKQFFFKQQFFFQLRHILHMVTELHVQNKKIARAVLSECLLMKTCHFELSTAIFSAFWLFMVNRNFFSSSGICHIILHMVAELHV